MAVYDHYMGRSEQNEYAKGGCYSIIMLFVLGAGFIGSIHLVVWIFG